MIYKNSMKFIGTLKPLDKLSWLRSCMSCRLIAIWLSTAKTDKTTLNEYAITNEEDKCTSSKKRVATEFIIIKSMQ